MANLHHSLCALVSGWRYAWGNKEMTKTDKLDFSFTTERELISAIRTINHSNSHKIEIEGDDEPAYWQCNKKGIR